MLIFTGSAERACQRTAASLAIMSVQGVALLFSSLGLALYTGARLGLCAHKSSVALAKIMGPPGKTEAIVLSLSVVCLLATAIWFFVVE